MIYHSDFFLFQGKNFIVRLKLLAPFNESLNQIRSESYKKLKKKIEEAVRSMLKSMYALD